MAYTIKITNNWGKSTAYVYRRKVGDTGSPTLEKFFSAEKGNNSYDLLYSSGYQYYFSITSNVDTSAHPHYEFKRYTYSYNGSSAAESNSNPFTTSYAVPSGNSYFTVGAGLENYKVEFSSNNTSYGKLDSTWISVPYNTTYSGDNATGKMTFKATGYTYTVTATPDPGDAKYGYAFNYWSSTSGTITANKSITGYFKQYTKTYNITLHGNGGKIDGADEYVYKDKKYETPISLKSASREKGSSNYIAKFYDGNTLKYQRNIPYSITYTYLGYSTKEVSSETTRSWTVYGDEDLYAQWKPTNGKGSISDFPSDYSKPGYKFNCWYTDPSGGTRVTSSTKFDDNVNLYALLTPNVYQVKYNLRSGESWAGEKPSQLYFYKTFDEATSLISDRVQRTGYTFKGWCEQKEIIDAHGETVKHTYAAGAGFDDAIYVDNNYQGPINLYPWFEPIDNKVTYKYYTKDGKEHIEVETYNIENTLMINQPYKKGDPVTPFVPGDSDYTFLGWTFTKPEGIHDSEGTAEWLWGDGSDKGKGLFLNPEEVKDCFKSLEPVHNPLTIYTNNKTQWGTSDVYYGLWTKTGKYAKTKDGWKKISTMYIMSKEANESEPTWKTVTDVWVKTEDGWKHEI